MFVLYLTFQIKPIFLLVIVKLIDATRYKLYWVFFCCLFLFYSVMYFTVVEGKATFILMRRLPNDV